MLAVVSPLENKTCRDGKGPGEMVGFTIGDDFVDFSDDNLLESICFDDLFVGMDDQDFLPDLEMDAELLAGEFSFSGGEDSSEFNNSMTPFSGDQKVETLTSKKDEFVSKREGSETVAKTPSRKETDGGRKSSSQEKSKNSQGKRKVKVDWTPELHRRFVQAVEQLGLEKAVPSRILEIMGIDCLTRHNIASHLQKYRSHRKHLQAREAEAASWSQRRQMYGGKTAADGGGNKGHWVAPPTMGFPPTMQPLPHFRPLHVWGHPSMDRPLMPAVWPKHIAGNPPPPPHLPPHVWPSPPSPHPQPPTWHHHHQTVPSSLAPGASYFPQLLPQTRFPVTSIPPPHAMYKIDSGIGVGVSAPPTPQPPLDLHPSKESIDAAIGDILSKPWQPLPLGLKPPALDSVMVELHKQGIQKIPPSSISKP